MGIEFAKSTAGKFNDTMVGVAQTHTRPAHHGQHRVAAPQHGPQIAIDGLAQSLGRVVEERPYHAATGIVDQDVDAPEGHVGQCHLVAHRGFIAEIADERRGALGEVLGNYSMPKLYSKVMPSGSRK